MAQINADEITQLLKEQIQNYDAEISVDQVGTIISLGDGIARLHGLDKAMAGEMLKFPHGVEGLAMNLDEDQVGCVILGDYTDPARGRRGQAQRRDYECARGQRDDWPRGQRHWPADR